MTAEAIFKRVIRHLQASGVYPSPTALNLLVHGRISDNLNGREAKWRREEMTVRGISLQRPNGSLAAKRQHSGRSNG